MLIIVCNSIVLCSNSSIQGYIIDLHNNDPLIGANIMLHGTMLGNASDENGNYLIENVPIGSYTLKAMFIGYENLEKEIWIQGNQAYIIDIRLKPSAIELQETKVTAEKRKGKITEAPASIEIVSSRDIKREVTTNIGSYLKGLKGVDFTSSGINNYSISIRGFNSSFNTRVLTLTDGRVANIPALRVINYSAVPQSMDDIDRMEIVLGPATALYGANAHSGVVNIISKSPAHSEGFTMSVSGSNDERELRKINGRWAKKISNSISIKLSGVYLHAYEWPYISETEYKSHLYPWAGNPHRAYDGKDNNPWNAFSPSAGLMDTTNDGRIVMIGDGEKNHGDLDGDGVAGEDWFNGYDDDGDCKLDTNKDGCRCCSGDIGVDEDYFTANNFDDDGDGIIDENIDSPFDVWIDGYDNDGNGQIDDVHEMSTDINNVPEWQYNMEERNIIIKGGRSDSLIHGQPNPWYIEGVTLQYADLGGDFIYDEENVRFIFDIYVYDYGDDGIPGDPFEDLSGDNKFQLGECLGQHGALIDECDVGLDGIANTCDYGEGDGEWQPGDGWQDTNNNGIPEQGYWGCSDCDQYICPCGIDENGNCNNYSNECVYGDAWPPKNNIWDSGENIFDCGQDGLCPDDNGYIAPDAGEGDGILVAWDSGENDNIFDTGDKIYGFIGDQFSDDNENGRWDEGEKLLTDENGDGQYTPPDYVEKFQYVDDVNGDGLSDYPEFEVENKKVEFRLDFDPHAEINMTFQVGYAQTKTQQVTGTGRYLADGFEYKFYQLRGRFYNWYSQIYLNESFSGNTRSYNSGSVVEDHSKNYAFQLQRNNDLSSLNTMFVWGIDYFKTLPSTNGTILNDGPNGYDNDGDYSILAYNNIDDDGDGKVDDEFCPDGSKGGRRNGQPWDCYEGIDEPDEFDNPESNEYGIYYQLKTELFGTSRYELITAARWDYHDLLEEGIQFAPKLGFVYKPDEKSSFRFTYGKAFNTPNSITLYTDLFVGKQGIFDIFLRGNKEGTPYCRVGDPCSGIETASANTPGFYKENGDFHSLSSVTTPGNTCGDYFSGYNERVHGAPYFYNFNPNLADGVPKDMIPLDTSRYLIHIPELNGDGMLYTPKESINIPNVDPIKTEKIQTVEFGYKGFFGQGNERTHITLDYYLSYYEDFFSPPTFITPAVYVRSWINGKEIRNVDSLIFAGIMPVNSFGGNAPYGTAWNGLDDDGDWVEWADEFGWWDDDDDNCPAQASQDPLNPHPCWADQGEWGFISNDTTTYEPYEVLEINGEVVTFKSHDSQGNQIDAAFFDEVGVDEYSNTGLMEAEMIPSGLGDESLKPGLAYSPPHLVLSPMNYGNVWMQGLDMGITHLIPEYNLVIDGNLSWYGTTDYYNELTKKNDPINAPKWKWNTSIKWTSPTLGGLAVNYRHVDEFSWKDGIWEGTIGPYDIFDFHYNYMISVNMEISVSALNFFDNHHKELIGGAKMGRQVIMRIKSIL